MAQTFETWTDETAARDVVYDKTKTNFETIRSSWSGTSFPENPVVGQPCYRTDEDKLYYWNGTEWGEKGGGGGVDLNTGDEIFNWIGTSAEYTAQNIESEHPEYLCYITDDNDGISASRYIGEIFYTMRTDELQGAVDCDGGLYSSENFTGSQNVFALLSAGKIPYVSMTDFDACVTEHGSCRCFGWNGADATVFRVPLLEDVYLMAGTAASAGEFIIESLPNIRGNISNSLGDLVVLPQAGTVMGGAFQRIEGVSQQQVQGSSDRGQYNQAILFDASRSSSTYQDGAKVRPDSVRYRAMVQLASSVKEDATQLKEYKFNNPCFFGQSIYSDVEPNNASWLKSAGQWNAGTVYTGMYNWLLEKMNAGVDGFKGTVGYAWKSQTADLRFWTAIRNPGVGCAVYGGVGIPFAGSVTAVNPDGTLNFYEVSTGVTYENLVYTESENINNEGTAFGNLKFANDYDFVINTADQTFRLPLLNGDENWVGNTSQTLSTADIVNGTPFTWTATKNGFINFTCYDNTTQVVIARINNQVINYTGAGVPETVIPRPGFWLKVKKGDAVSIAAESGTLKRVSISFIPAVGNGSLYYYIGDTLQNAQLVNVARIEETLVTKTNKVQAAEASMPSGKYINLTLGASGSTYTAPANGWFTINKGGTSGQLFAFENVTAGGVTWIAMLSLASDCRVSCPAKKGDSVVNYYNATGTTNFFRFVYAEGEN